MILKTSIKIKAIVVLVLLTIIFGCSKNNNEDPSPKAYISSFSFLMKNNAGLSNDVHLEISNNEISGGVPISANIQELIASFELINCSLLIDGEVQTSGNMVNDFLEIINYTLVANDGTEQSYLADVAWFTGLPIIYINTDGEVEIDSKDYYFPGSVEVVGGKDFENISGVMGIRGRGHSTWYFHPKKPYQLKFDQKTAILGMPADKKWIFLAEFSDKTLIRTKLAFEMGNLSKLEWTPQCEYAEVFINGTQQGVYGNHQGVYNISQKVEESDNRLPLGDDGYLMELDVPDHLKEGDVYFTSNHFTVQIKEPEVETGSPEYEYAQNYVNEFETALYSDNFTDPQIGYRKYVDVESFIDWYLINEMAKNQDAKDYSSMCFTLMPGQKIKMGPIWDFDLAFGNVYYSHCQDPELFWVKEHAWISRMFDDPEFASAVKERFQYFKSKEAYFLDFIDRQAKTLKWAQKKNDTKWDLMGRWVWPNSVVFDSYQKEVDFLKAWFSQRMAWLDEAYQEID